MSWQNYIDQLMATGDLTHAGIYSLEGSQWAVSKGFPVNKNSYFLFLFYKIYSFSRNNFLVSEFSF